jgi:hypothetical protein
MKAIYHLFCVGIFLSSCSTIKHDTTKVKTSDVFEDHQTSAYVFQEGVYYQFRFDEVTTMNGIDELALLNELEKQGVNWQEAWYKAPARMCTPPGSEMGMMVIVEPAFVIKVKKESEKLSQLGFELKDEPSLGDCAYRVKRYSR